jgi:hypothetical protein
MKRIHTGTQNAHNTHGTVRRLQASHGGFGMFSTVSALFTRDAAVCERQFGGYLELRNLRDKWTSPEVACIVPQKPSRRHGQNEENSPRWLRFSGSIELRLGVGLKTGCHSLRRLHRTHLGPEIVY